MRIIVTELMGKSKQYLVEVLDDQNFVVYSEQVKGVKLRDNVVWKLAELYNVVDIQTKKDKKETFMFSEIPSIPVLDEEEAEYFFEENKDFVYDRILQAVDEGIAAGRGNIRLFELSGTEVYITSEQQEWLQGVQQALEHFTETEQYEKSGIAKSIIDKLQR